MANSPLKVAWCSYFPVEWLPDAPEAIRALPKRHPASWLQSGVEEFKKVPEIELHVIELRKELLQDITFVRGNITFHCLKVPGGLRAPSMFWLDTYLIRRRLKQIQPQVLHAWGTEKGAALVASRLPYPYLVSLQGLMEYFAGLIPPNRYERLAAYFERVSLRRAKLASGESSFVVDWLREHYPHLHVHHVEHSPSAALYDIQRQPQTAPLDFLFLGGMSYRKGIDLLLLGLDRLRAVVDFRLTMIGFAAQIDLIERLRAQTSPDLWKRVTIMNTAPTADVMARLARATMMLFPTRADTGPVAVKEAAIAGVPIIGSVMGGIPDYVVPGKNGFTHPPGDIDAFVDCVRQASAHPLFSQGKVDPETLAKVRQHLSPARMAQGFLKIYRQLAGK